MTSTHTSEPSSEEQTWLDGIQAQLLASQRPVNRISWHKIKQPEPTQSRLGGIAYLPSDATHPTSPTGQKLSLLAQINFAEMPALDGFPDSGLLQIFIDSTHSTYGLEFDAESFKLPQSPFHQVMFWPDLTHADTWKQSPVDQQDDFGMPIRTNTCFQMVFEPAVETIGSSDVGFSKAIGAAYIDEIPRPASISEDRVYEIAEQYWSRFGNKVGGHPSFTQSDPRSSEDGLVLLLQLDSDDEANMMWGDAGIANWFINPNKLEKADFSEVVYNWDCC
ncbi:MAG: DUF1963 domain-containing protein [Pseudomonadota bacterium]|nr:DUF1963 domain-containing protein [Pseudomonadota bacterium]